MSGEDEHKDEIKKKKKKRVRRRRRRDQSKDKVKEDTEFREEKSCGPLQGGCPNPQNTSRSRNRSLAPGR